MAKTNGLGATIAVDTSGGTPETITNDVTDFSMATPVALQDITGVDSYAHEKLGLLADGTVSLKGVFNAAASMSHATLSDVPSTIATRTVKITPTSVTTPYLSMEMLFSSYDITRAADGALTWQADASLQSGLAPSWTNS